MDDEGSYASPVAAKLIDDREQVVFFTRTGLAILDAEDGKVRHQKRWRARIAASCSNATRCSLI